MITIILPWPPSVNHYYGHTKNGRVYLKESGKRYRRNAAVEFARMGWPRMEGPVRVYLVLYPPDHRRRDIDNIRKCLYDAISDRKKKGVVVHRGIIPDDANIKEDGAEFGECVRGEVRVEIEGK